MSLELVSKGPDVLLAAVTLGHLDEPPFPRQGKREARILLKEPTVAVRSIRPGCHRRPRPGDLSTSPSRRDSGEQFLEDSLQGLGTGEEHPVQSPPMWRSPPYPPLR